MTRLDGKIAVVTGASKGIGAAIAERLAEDGAAVVINYSRSRSEAQAVVSRIAAKGGRAMAFRADVSRLPEIKGLFDATLREFGRVDILVNNAGSFEFLPLQAIHEDHFNRQFDTNVKGLLFASQAAANAFGEQGGSIINISSIVSLAPRPNGAVYSASKAAVDAFTRSLAAELGPKKILVNSVLPGATDTDGFNSMAGSAEFRAYAESQTPLARIGQPRDIANVVSFLASAESAWITGQLIAASGGFH